MVTKALLVAVVFLICRLTVYQMPNLMLDRPIFLGPLIGLVLGDFQTGCLIGASLELVYMGVVIVGTATSADPGAAVAIAVPFAILNNLSVNEAIAIAVPIGYLCTVLFALEPVLGEIFTPIVDSFMDKDDYRGWTISGIGLSIVAEALLPVCVFFALAFGGDLVETFVNSLPSFILNGVNVAGAMLPAVGLAVLTSQIWNAKASIFFLFGFFLMKYAEIDIIFLTVIAILIALMNLYGYMDAKKQMESVKLSAVTTDKDDVEDFFV